jgi:protein tyrosine phosphatase
VRQDESEDIDMPVSLDFLHVANSFRRHYGETNPCLVHCTAGYGFEVKNDFTFVVLISELVEQEFLFFCT